MKNKHNLLRTLLIFTFILLISTQARAQSVTINESAGWLETAFVKWQPVSGAESYNVYYSGEGVTDIKIDNQLIRSYGSYYRADAIGLKAGNYILKVAPVIAGVEGEMTSTSSLAVLAHDRNGFAFDGGRVPGAYKADGTPKDGAVIIYVTQNTKNTVSVNITGASSNPCVGLQNILYGIKKGKDTRPFIIRLIGNITDMAVMEGGDITIENAQNPLSHLTLEGVGSDAVVNGMGIRLKTATNIEVRNLGTMNCNSTAGDNIGLQQKNDHIWVHNCDLFYGDAGSDSDQAKGDGALDNKGSTYVTFSYNHFWDSGKASLLGLSEGTTTGLYITYHHNWFDHSDSRHPRVRYYSAHVYNNYYDGNAKYGAGSTNGSSVFMEGNYFRNCKRPMLTSMQGTDVWSEAKQANDPSNIGTFSGEDGGTIKAFNNTFDYTNIALRFVAYGDTNPLYNIAGKISSTIDFDAYVSATRGEQVPSTVKSYKGANTYNNFDTDAALYVKNLVIDEPAIARDKVMQYAGRVEGGDLKFTFNNLVDDPSYAVNTAMKSTLTSYTSSLVSVQGETTTVESSQTLTADADIHQAVEEEIAIEPIIFTWGGDATDATVTGLPASGISFVKDATAKTITVSGTPTANVSFSVTTSGSAGNPATLSGSITIGSVVEPPAGDMIHNFTVSGKTSTFYTITGNMNSTNGSVSYAGLTLTSRLKIESSTNITFSTTQAGILTLVLDATFNGSIKVDGTSYTAVAGIVTVSISAGSHTITKGDTTNLYYISVTNSTTGLQSNEAVKLTLYPNPVVNYLTVSTNAKVEKTEVYSLTGVLVNRTGASIKNIDLSSLSNGSYLVKVYTEQGVTNQIIIKK
jgi:pectate lyase